MIYSQSPEAKTNLIKVY